jgi:hypothetical protein
MFGSSYSAAGGADALEEILKQKFIEMVQRKKLAQDDRSLDMQGSRDAVTAELGRGNLGVAKDRVGLEGRRVTLDENQFGEDTRRFNMEQPIRARLTTAQAADIERRPEAERQGREHDASMAELGGRIQGRLIDRRAAADTSQGGRRQLQQVIDAQGNPQIVSVDVTTGQSLPVQLPAGTQPNRPSKPVTGAERQVVAFYSRAKEADELARKFEEPVAKAGIASQLQQQFAPNILQTSDQQSYRQAQRAFTEARLRKESGAAIPQGEYDTDAKTYFAQPGDSPQVREQKRKARETVLEGLKFSAGRAFQEFYGEGGAKPAGGGSVTVTAPNGQTFTFPNQAAADAFKAKAGIK